MAAHSSFYPWFSLVFFQGPLKQDHTWARERPAPPSSLVNTRVCTTCFWAAFWQLWDGLAALNKHKKTPKPFVFSDPISHGTCQHSAAKKASLGSHFTYPRVLSGSRSMWAHPAQQQPGRPQLPLLTLFPDRPRRKKPKHADDQKEKKNNEKGEEVISKRLLKSSLPKLNFISAPAQFVREQHHSGIHTERD